MPSQSQFQDPSRSWGPNMGASVPEKTKCKVDKKVKKIDQFSNKQKNDLVAKMKGLHGVAKEGHLRDGWITCKACTSQQTVELQCTGKCGEWKPLEDFAKTQRRNRDNAKCKPCMEDILKVQPDEPLREDSEDEVDGNESSDSNRYDDGDDVTEITTSVNDMSMDGTNRFSTTSVQSTDGGTWVTQQRNFLPSSAASGPPNFDINAYGGSSRRGGPASQSHSGFGSGRGSYSASQVKESKSGWAKVPSSKKDMFPEDLPDSDDDDWNKHQEEDDSDDDGP